MQSLSISRNVFTRVCDNQLVFLDLKQDKYLAIDTEAASKLCGKIHGWPHLTEFPERSSCSAATDANLLSEKLKERGVLTECPNERHTITPIAIPEPMHCIGDLTLSEDAEMKVMKHLPAFLRVFLAAKTRLHVLPLETVVTSVHTRRQRFADDDSVYFDVPRAQCLIRIFNLFWPFVSRKNDACLLYSLSLLNFLALHDLLANWVFGVQVRPFLAHCWAQHGSIVLNDSPDHVRTFRPILVV